MSSDVQFEARRKALAAALRLENVMAKTGTNPVQQILLHMGDFFEWRDYPDGGVWDRASGYGYFYHAHPGSAFETEHGHFHLFWGQDREVRVNLAALSMDQFGQVMGVSVPNGWHVPVAGDAASVQLYDRFDVALAFPCYAANQWLSAAVRALAPRLGGVHRAALTGMSDSATVNDRGRGILAAAGLRLDEAAVAHSPAKLARPGR